MPKEDIIFLHIPKTAGTTLRSLFFEQYKYLKSEETYEVRRLDDLNHFWSLNESEATKIKLILGHCRYGVHYKFSRPFKYVTFLRSPVTRSLSSYFFTRWDKNNFYQQMILSEKISATDYLCSGRFPWEENNQTKLIAGVENLSEPCTEQIYQRAIHNLTENFIHVGIVEAFQESLNELSKKLSWLDYKSLNLNVTPKAAKSQPISEPEFQKIQDINFYDQKLYEYSLNMLD